MTPRAWRRCGYALLTCTAFALGIAVTLAIVAAHRHLLFGTLIMVASVGLLLWQIRVIILTLHESYKRWPK